MHLNMFVRRYGKFAPSVSLVCGLVTLFGTYALAVLNNHIPEGMWLPFISLNGALAPERWLYLAGFWLTSIGICVSAKYAKDTFLWRAESHLQCLAKISYYFSLIAAMGLIVQATIPLQSNIFDVIKREAELRAQSMIHQTGALVLFLAGYAHCITMDILLFRSHALPSSTFSKRLKLVLTFLMLAPFFLAFIPHPASSVGPKKTVEEISYGAVGQWTCVGALLLYFASYHLEFCGTHSDGPRHH
ncbi:hypothetical protein GUITHDRAFT_149743 [Guillardia theta CCMP2712]|uniref:CWH43-like N-terminal domain-containing protein n=1 Tax=Guillardia theta (strain CCMP2712) TaxID=905079 RepID=L1K469_GUITC|nr:hypothetical protein GUITHDRAFT_149743 [Guillardia theta CCMP2712]EKX55260.1 hypothetical protein GUITHDRAFT_149743 [Guillardia theta CCMP2712]|eukprot:XP_005842240.1 hypothetical protein GUITHDRAFT_149743 [Guillardia theta CCMP2712]